MLNKCEIKCEIHNVKQMSFLFILTLHVNAFLLFPQVFNLLSQIKFRKKIKIKIHGVFMFFVVFSSYLKHNMFLLCHQQWEDTLIAFHF